MRTCEKSFDSAAAVLCDELAEAVTALPEGKKDAIQEIRLRAEKPLALTDGTSAMFTDGKGRILYSMSSNALIATRRHLYDTFRRLCGYSVYSCQNDIKNGFITVQGGHRVGLCGTAVVSEGKITAVNEISSLNIRISRQIPGVSQGLLQKLTPMNGGLLLAGVPSSGKTTLLRDLARSLSLGLNCKMMRTVVIDERGELSGTFRGSAYNDLGLCDIMNGYPKGEGIIHAIRALSPQVIVCDELGTEEDCRAVAQGFHAGAWIVASIHAGSLEELQRRSQGRRLLRSGAFRTVTVLTSCDRPCEISGIYRIQTDGSFVPLLQEHLLTR